MTDAWDLCIKKPKYYGDKISDLTLRQPWWWGLPLGLPSLSTGNRGRKLEWAQQYLNWDKQIQGICFDYWWMPIWFGARNKKNERVEEEYTERLAISQTFEVSKEIV